MRSVSSPQIQRKWNGRRQSAAGFSLVSRVSRGRVQQLSMSCRQMQSNDLGKQTDRTWLVVLFAVGPGISSCSKPSTPDYKETYSNTKKQKYNIQYDLNTRTKNATYTNYVSVEPSPYARKSQSMTLTRPRVRPGLTRAALSSSCKHSVVVKADTEPACTSSSGIPKASRHHSLPRSGAEMA